RDDLVTGVQTCALPILTRPAMAVPIALLVSALTACRPDEPRPPAAGASAVAAVASGPQDTAFAGKTAPVHRARPTRPGVPLAMRSEERRVGKRGGAGGR